MKNFLMNALTVPLQDIALIGYHQQ
uniref:Uncharacterized protein n=1 Tax=Arundo donax TaxID=35708 RepID=A0A0A9GFJ7_ARUDO